MHTHEQLSENSSLTLRTLPKVIHQLNRGIAVHGPGDIDESI